MASRQQPQESLPPYSRRPVANEQTIAIAPDFPLAIEAIQVIQEWFPGTRAGDAWGFIQQLAHLIRADVRSQPRNSDPGENASHSHAPERPGESNPSSNIPEDSPMPDAA